MKQKILLDNKTILITGSPGFIGANLVLRLLNEMSGGTVISFDSMNDSYDPRLKEYRLNIIEAAAKESPVRYVFVRGNLADKPLVNKVFSEYKPAVTVCRRIPSSSLPTTRMCPDNDRGWQRVLPQQGRQ